MQANGYTNIDFNSSTNSLFMSNGTTTSTNTSDMSVTHNPFLGMVNPHDATSESAAEVYEQEGDTTDDTTGTETPVDDDEPNGESAGGDLPASNGDGTNTNEPSNENTTGNGESGGLDLSSLLPSTNFTFLHGLLLGAVGVVAITWWRGRNT
jgi:hypothetical protein